MNILITITDEELKMMKKIQLSNMFGGVDLQNDVREFYNSYGIKEWERLDKDIYNRINFMLHMDFIKENLFNGAEILDAGCGAGRFAIELAKAGCKVSLFDISDEQLKIANAKIEENHLENCILGYTQGDIRDLSTFPDDCFDIVICYGAPLSYVLEGREHAITEFKRVLKKDGSLAISVNNKWGIFKDLLGRGYQDFFNNPEYWYIDKVITSGDLPIHEKVNQPARHFFDASELSSLMTVNGFCDIELGASPCLLCGNRAQVNELCKDEKAYKTLMDIELQTYKKSTMVDNGEFLLIKGKPMK